MLILKQIWSAIKMIRGSLPWFMILATDKKNFVFVMSHNWFKLKEEFETLHVISIFKIFRYFVTSQNLQKFLKLDILLLACCWHIVIFSIKKARNTLSLFSSSALLWCHYQIFVVKFKKTWIDFQAISYLFSILNSFTKTHIPIE